MTESNREQGEPNESEPVPVSAGSTHTADPAPPSAPLSRPPGGYGTELPPGLDPLTAVGVADDRPVEGTAIISAVMGAITVPIALTMGLHPCFYLAIAALGITVITLGIHAIRQTGTWSSKRGRPLAIAGIILGSLALLLPPAVWVTMVLALSWK